jgi:hypothetical protein
VRESAGAGQVLRAGFDRNLGSTELRGQSFAAQKPGQTEIQNLGVPTFGNEYVRRLDIAWARPSPTTNGCVFCAPRSPCDPSHACVGE